MAYIQPKNLTVGLIKKQVIRVEKLVGQKNKFKDIAFKKQRLFNERKKSEEERKKNRRSFRWSRKNKLEINFLFPNLVFWTL